MKNAFIRAFSTPDLRSKILFTLGLLAIYRLGVFIPTPGFDYTTVKQCATDAMQGDSAGLLGMVSLFSGGALLQLSVFALGVMPYITASIIIQLLRVVIPRFETLKQEGQTGQMATAAGDRGAPFTSTISAPSDLLDGDRWDMLTETTIAAYGAEQDRPLPYPERPGREVTWLAAARRRG